MVAGVQHSENYGALTTTWAEPGDAGKHDSEYGEGRYCVVRGDVRWSSMGSNIGCIGSLAEATRRGVVVSEVRSILK